MSFIHQFICSLFQSNTVEYELTTYDDAYIESCVDEAIGVPNPFIVCDAHSHVIIIMDIMKEDRLAKWNHVTQDRVIAQRFLNSPRPYSMPTRLSLNEFILQ